jgi:sulfonate transport system permease protein
MSRSPRARSNVTTVVSLDGIVLRRLLVDQGGDAERTSPALTDPFALPGSFPEGTTTVRPGLTRRPIPLANRVGHGFDGAIRSLGGLFWRYGAILLFLLAWQVLSELDLIDSSVIPPFTKVVVAMIHGFIDGGLLKNMLISLRRSGIAFGIAITLAVPLGLFMGTFRRFESFIDALVQTFRQTSALAIYPIFILLLGLGETSKITIICWAAFFPILLNTISGVKLVDTRLIEMARVFGASKREVFKRVVLPAAGPSIFVGLRLSATTSLLLLVAAEMIGAKQGLGFLIINAQYNFEIPLMFAAIVLLACIGLTVNYTLLTLQGWCCRWESSAHAKGRAPGGRA